MVFATNIQSIAYIIKLILNNTHLYGYFRLNLFRFDSKALSPENSLISLSIIMKLTRFKFLYAALIFTSSSIGQNTVGDVFFSAPKIHDVYFTFSQTGYWDSLKNNYTADVYMKCNLVVDGTNLPTCGVKFKGNSSYNNPSNKKSFKIGFDEYVSTQDYDGLNKLNLNNGFKDPSFLREKIALDVLNAAGYPAPRCAYARLYINGTYWGLYTAVEEINKDFLKDRFSDKKGNLFKGDPSGDLKWLGASPSLYYTKYELKTNTTANNWSDLVRLIDKINNSTTAQFYDSLETILNTKSWIQGWAGENIFSNLDSYIGSGHNYYIYDDSITNKFNWIPWDVNEAFGNFTMGMSVTQMESLSIFFLSNPATNRPLANKMLSNSVYKSRLVNEICYLTGFYFKQSYLFPKIDSIAAAIKADVYADNLKFFTNADFDKNIDTTVTQTSGPMWSFPGIKSFINHRRASLLSELAANGCSDVGVQELSTQRSEFSVFPNPANDKIAISSNNEPIKVIELYDLGGQKLFSETKEPCYSTSISLSSLPSGIYLLKINATAVQKLSVIR